jgi:hypothetical protein
MPTFTRYGKHEQDARVAGVYVSALCDVYRTCSAAELSEFIGAVLDLHDRKGDLYVSWSSAEMQKKWRVTVDCAWCDVGEHNVCHGVKGAFPDAIEWV